MKNNEGVVHTQFEPIRKTGLLYLSTNLGQPEVVQLYTM
jgi:hypothetical protein